MEHPLPPKALYYTTALAAGCVPAEGISQVMWNIDGI